MTPDDDPPQQFEIERLIRRLSDTERDLQAFGAGELDAVVDRRSATTILLNRAQRAIAQSEARFRTLVNRCPALVCEIDASGRTVFVNDAARSILGIEPEELMGAIWWSSLVPEPHLPAARHLAALVQKGDVTSFELPVRGRGGERWLLLNTANRYTDDGALAMVTALGIDITERKVAEESARKLAEAELARSEAEASNKAKMDFLAVMSHELRTPLNAIGGYAELLEMGLRGPITPEQLEDLGKIRRSQRHLLGLINDIMNFARLETGHVSIRPASVSVNETLAVLDALTEPQVAAKGIRYVRGRCEAGLTVWADEEKTRQILINLVSNAIKFTDDGGTITITCDASDDTVTFEVQDTGRGIPDEKLEAIFEPFVQVNKQFTRDEGVGLGLAISRDLARMMDGDLTARSTLGKGSAFFLTLPRRPITPSATPPADQREPHGAPESSSPPPTRPTGRS
jgi:PAS domain S-box-containing protein